MYNIKTEKAWIRKIFESDQAIKGGIVRRSISSVNKYASEAELIMAIKARGFHYEKANGQFVIYCNQNELKLAA